MAAGATEESASKKGRSGTIHWLHMTEVAFWGAAAETMTALMAAAEHGYIVAESTANGAAGTFYDLCTTTEGGEWSFKFFPWYEHAEYRKVVPEGFDPAIRVVDGKPDANEVTLRERGCDDEQIAWWRARVSDPARGGLAKVKQEYPIDPASCFTLPGGAFLDEETCDWLATKAAKATTEAITIASPIRKSLGSLVVFDPPVVGASYVIGADISEGVQGDESALDVMDRRSGMTVATWASNTISPGDFGLVLAWTARHYNGALVAPERNNHGHTTLRTLSAEVTDVTPYRNVFVATDGRHGWLTSAATRPVMFDELAGALRDRSTWSPDLSFAQQSRTLVRDKSTGKPVAMGKGSKGGARDDRWIARAIAWQLRTRTTGKRPNTGDGQRQQGSGYDGV